MNNILNICIMFIEFSNNRNIIKTRVLQNSIQYFVIVVFNLPFTNFRMIKFSKHVLLWHINKSEYK